MMNIQVGDFVRILPESTAVSKGWAKAGEIAEVTTINSDGHGVDVKTVDDPWVPLENNEFKLYMTKEEADNLVGSEDIIEMDEAYHESFDDVMSKQSDAINHPNHYNQGRFETIEIIEHLSIKYNDGFVAHCVATAFKYMDRAPYKHDTPTECLRKAAKYLEFAIEHLDEKATQ